MDVSVGTQLRVLRKDAGLTQAQLAALADTNQAAINRYETDRAAALKKNGDTVHVDAWIGLENSKNGNYVGDIRTKYTVMLIKDGKKMRVALWDLAKEKECKPGKTASYKKSGKYYVITINDMPLENVVYKDEQTSKINTKTKYNLGQGISVTGTCSKTSGYVYVDDLKISGVTTQKITFNKKDYKWYSGWHLDKNYSLKVTTIK